MGLFDLAKGFAKDIAKDVASGIKDEVKNQVKEKAKEKVANAFSGKVNETKVEQMQQGELNEKEAGSLIQSKMNMIAQLVIKYGGDFSKSMLEDDKALEKILRRIHSFLPPPIRMVVWKKKFVKLMIANKSLLIDLITKYQNSLQNKLENYDSTQNLQLEESYDSLETQFTQEERDYIELLEDSLENSEINENTRKLLNRRREKLGITMERAIEIEEIVLISENYTDEELEYIEEFEECYKRDEKLSDSEIKILNKLRIQLNITQERANELEILIVNK